MLLNSCNKSSFCLHVREYADCTHDEKLSCVALIEQIFSFAIIARDKGIPALEGQLENISDDLLKDGIGLILDGTNTDLLGNILDTSIIFSYKTGVELLKQLIIREGVLGISHGYNPKIIELWLWRYLGEDFRRANGKEES